ncbi:protein PHYTOCHROME KINASE SUBSTRATE 1 isoform X2 [Spinacia oleracea]|uniref:Protein PHYTOCHROME KINASE SUBSTRATE 1 isoform X2 n=1 Tax=Spinacia oleracea TaxID=3562 RepID=A0ABM3QQ27_SPIOL|nr:protein PHYTOCHROME KINASE SUBSTRATE 1-like isoform X2 [Spinacia oleracea]
MASLSSSSTNTRLSLPPYWSSEINNTSSLREASFSSYLNPSEEAYIRSLVESTQNQHDHHLHKSRQKKKKKAEDGEIDVFTADKYFSSGVIDQESDKFSTRSISGRFQQQQQHRHDVEDRTDDDQQQVVRVNSNNKLIVVQSRGSSSQSEVSSNSQSALLRRRLNRTPSRTTNERKTNQQQGKTMSLLACSCCVGKSVDTDQEFTDHGSRGRGRGRGRGRISDGTQTRSIKTSLDTAEIARMNKLRLDNNVDPFVFPLSNSASLTAINKLVDVDEDDARKSLEVFGSDLDEGSKRFTLQKRLNMLSWDAIPRGTTEDQISTTSDAPSETYKDTESDASSDLFEIECLSCTSNPFNQTPTTTRYAPSEASIEWSVVTASAADFSVVSDSEDYRSRKLAASKSAKRSMNKEVQKQGSGVFLGCKSQKAVNVAKEVHRKSPVRGKSESQRMNRLSDSFNPVTRFQAEAKLPGFGYRQRHSFTSDLLYIQ